MKGPKAGPMMGMAALALVAGLLTACGSSSDDASGPVEITWWHGQTELQAKVIEELAAEYSKAHPDVKITPAVGSTNVDDMLQKVQAVLAGGKAPDIAYMYGTWMPNLARNPKVYDLAATVKAPGFGWDDFWPSERAVSEVNGKVVGVPALVDNLAVIYNKKLFDAAGLPYPSKDWTWDDFRATAKKLTGGGVYGTAYPVTGLEDTVWRFWPMIWQQGGSIVTPDGKKSAFNTPQAAQALDLWTAMAQQDKSVYLDQNGEKFVPLFQSGKIGMIAAAPYALLDVIDHKISYGVQVLPGYNGNHETVAGPDNWVVFDNGSRRAKAAAEFLTWLTRPEQDARWSLGLGNLPLRKATTALPAYQKFVKDFPGIDVFTANLENAKQARPPLPAYPEFSEKVGNAIAQSLVGGTPAQQSLTKAATEADAVLGRSR
ncbi:ABC transporter substrate-binding protein [Nonomuraea angiospora]|uniref:ABC transporter substrate-binding protein n=1 Tax=Nonomuraea angiospora TaxID=46172 RepID=UPI0029AB7B41|nr:ABC transporter substrate-binding protein [Nonomuraea angiospora]MDX3105556.1 ABC transporter substrate-binding protein [Nonomuraea angiospora]